MGIRGWFRWLALLYSTILLGSAQRDSIVIDTEWNYWSVNDISANGDWTCIYQNYPNDRAKIKTFVMHTGTKKKTEVTGIYDPRFTAPDILLGKSDKGTVEVELKTQKQSALGILKQQDWIEASQTLCYITENNELVLRNYNERRAAEVITILGISKYYLSPSKMQLLYQKEGSGQIFVLDVETGKETLLTQLDNDLSSVTWNLDETAVVITMEGVELQYLDLKEGKHKLIEVPHKNEEGVLLNLSFFPNNDIYFERFVERKGNNLEEDYVDVWNGNDRELKYKVLPGKNGGWSTFIYHQNTNTLSELLTNKKKRYWNIGIDNHLLVFEPLELQNYSSFIEKVRYRILDLETNKELGDLTTTSSLINLLNKSLDNLKVLYPKGDVWEIYDFKTHRRITVPHQDRYSKPIWSANFRWVYYSNGQNLMKLNVESEKTKRVTNLKGPNHFSFVNQSRKGNSRYIDSSKPLLFSIRHKYDNMSYYSLFKGKVTPIVDNTPNRLNLQYLNIGVSEDGKTAVWTEENYNQPPTVKAYRKAKVKTLFEPQVPKELYTWQKQKVIRYKDKFGVELTGVLWYPKDFESTKRYPMITHIYDKQGGIRSMFEHSTTLVEAGFNRTLLNEQGYFVFMPDTYVSDEGAGLSALECVTKGIEAITTIEPSIDKTKLGLIGHSFGGYKSSFILSQTNLFAAGVSGAGIHDLIMYTYEYNNGLNMPNYFRVEGPQQDFRIAFGENSIKYYDNSPIHFAQDLETPILLWTGMQDCNVHWEQTRHMYVALQRYRKPVIALFYKEDDHSLRKKKEQLDLMYRVLDWFDYYLKDKKDVKWISKGIDYNNY